MKPSEYTVTGVIRLPDSLPVEAIAEALMVCAAEQYPKAAVAVDLSSSCIEIECLVEGDDVADGFATGESMIHDICHCAEFPVVIADNRRPCASEWRVVDESASALEPATG